MPTDNTIASLKYISATAFVRKHLSVVYVQKNRTAVSRTPRSPCEHNWVIHDPELTSYVCTVAACNIHDLWDRGASGERNLGCIDLFSAAFVSSSDVKALSSGLCSALSAAVQQFKPKIILMAYCIALVDKCLTTPEMAANLFTNYVFGLPASLAALVPALMPKISSRRFQERVLEDVFGILYHKMFGEQLASVSNELVYGSRRGKRGCVYKDHLFCAVIKCLSAYWHHPSFPSEVMINVVTCLLDLIEYCILQDMPGESAVLANVSSEMRWDACLGREEWRPTARRALYLVELARQRDPKANVYELEKMAGVGVELERSSVFVPVNRTKIGRLKEEHAELWTKMQEQVTLAWAEDGVTITGPYKQIMKARIAVVKLAVQLRRLKERMLVAKDVNYVLVPIEKTEYAYLRVVDPNVEDIKLHGGNTKSDPFLSRLMAHSYSPKEIVVDLVELDETDKMAEMLEKTREEAAKVLECDVSHLQLSTYCLCRTVVFKMDPSLVTPYLVDIGSGIFLKELIDKKVLQPVICIETPVSWMDKSAESLITNMNFSRGQERVACTLAGFVRDQESSAPQWRKFLHEAAVNMPSPPNPETSVSRGILGCGTRILLPVCDARARYPGMALQIRLRYSQMPLRDVPAQVPMESVRRSTSETNLYKQAGDATSAVVIMGRHRRNPSNPPIGSPPSAGIRHRLSDARSDSSGDLSRSRSNSDLAKPSLRSAAGFFGSKSNLTNYFSDSEPEFEESSVTGAAVATVVDREDSPRVISPRDADVSPSSVVPQQQLDKDIPKVYPGILQAWLDDVYCIFVELMQSLQTNGNDPTPVWVGNLCVPSLAALNSSVVCPMEEPLYANGRPVCRLEATVVKYYKRGPLVAKRVQDFWWFTRDPNWSLLCSEAPDLFHLGNEPAKNLVSFINEVLEVVSAPIGLRRRPSADNLAPGNKK